MKYLATTFLLFISIQSLYAQKVKCSNLESVFLTANLKKISDDKIFLESIKILGTNESTALARNSKADDINYKDFKSYIFRSNPSSLFVVDPKKSIGLLARLRGEPHGSYEYIGMNRKWVLQNQSHEFVLGNRVHFIFDYENAFNKKNFKLKAWHDIDQYDVPMEQELICSFK